MRIPGDNLRSPKWESFERKFIKGKTCAICGVSKTLNAHHIIPFHVQPSDELKVSNLIALCRKHHLEFGHLGNFKGWNPDVRADSKTFAQKRADNKTRIKFASTIKLKARK